VPIIDLSRPRLSVSNDVYDKFAEMLAEKVKAFKVGPGFDEGV
jgi:succinate-semialdehyde dehydrogenase/glutarate-semialdehyde dehydrogenase